MGIKPSCDCLNTCGDDPRLQDGRVKPCPHMALRLARPKVLGVSRVSDNRRAVLVVLSAEPTDDDLRVIHNQLRHCN